MDSKPVSISIRSPFLHLHKVFNSFGWEFSVIHHLVAQKGRSSSSGGDSSVHVKACFIWSASFFPQGVFGVMRHGRKRMGEFDGLYFYYEKTKRSGAFIRGFTEEGLTIRVTAMVQRERGGGSCHGSCSSHGAANSPCLM